MLLGAVQLSEAFCADADVWLNVAASPCGGPAEPGVAVTTADVAPAPTAFTAATRKL
jgi:hypothetical protein